MKNTALSLMLCLMAITTGRASAQTPSATFGFKITTNGFTAKSLILNNTPHKTTDVAGVQPPNISYATPQVYAINQPIPALNPVNNGGAVLATAPYGTVTTIAGSPKISYFLTITGVAVDGSGNIFVADYGTNEIKKITPSGSISIIAGTYNPGSNNGYGTSASFNYPDALLFDQNGNIFIADNGNNMIRELNPAGLVSTFAGSTTAGRQDAVGVNASFNAPRGMTFDAAGNLFVADQANNLIREITSAGIVTTYAGNGNAGLVDGQRLSSSFNSPAALTIDPSGNLYVSDTFNNVIRKISTNGIVSTFATGLNFPRELRLDAGGNLYVNDMNSYSVKKISPGGTLTTIAGSGISNNTDGIGIQASFTEPVGMDRDLNGDLIIGDKSFVRKISISGYSIDKPLPAGLIFNAATGVISGTPTTLSAPTNYTITAYNGYGSSQAIVNIAVASASNINNLLPSIIYLPPQIPGVLGAGNYYDPMGTSTNNETPITYTSSDPSIAYIAPDGRIKVIKPGIVTITAYQAGDQNYSPATPVTQLATFIEYMAVYLPPISNATLCTADFNANGLPGDPNFPVSYSSSNPAVATVNNNGVIHILTTGTTTITLSELGNPPFYISATPQSQTFVITPPITPVISIAAVFSSPCLGSPVTFTATPQNGGTAPNYQWQVNSINAGPNSNSFTTTSLADGDQVSCIITNTDNTCISTYTTKSNTITLSRITPSAPTVSITASTNDVFAGTPVTFNAVVKNANGGVHYQWLKNGVATGLDSSVFSSSILSNNDVITCAINPVALCSTPSTSNPIVLSIVNQVTIPNTFTPNGDGVNDKWNISGIGSFPNCLVNIYNRYGQLVYQSRGYQQPWDGTVLGRSVPASTYYYVIDLGIQNRTLGGYVTVLR